MRKNKLKKLFKEGKAAINGWIEIPSSYSAEAMAHQGWDSLTIDLQHGAISQSDILQIFQAISTTEVVPMARLNWNEPDQIMKALDYGAYGIICPMVSNRNQAEKFVQACMYPPKGYRSFGPTRGFMYGGNDYVDHANDEILKIAMIETKEALEKLDEIMSTPGVDGIYIGPADLSLAVGEKPSFDKPETDPVYPIIMNILEHAKKNNIFAGIHNMTAEYAEKMIEKGFQLVTVGSEQRFMTAGAKNAVEKLKGKSKGIESKTY